MKDYYILITKNIKDMVYSSSLKDDGTPFKRYIYNNIQNRKGNVKDYIQPTHFFHSEKLMLYQNYYETLDEFIESEIKLLREAFKKDDKFESNKKLLLNAIQYYKDNGIITFIKKDDYNHLDSLKKIHIRTQVRPTTNFRPFLYEEAIATHSPYKYIEYIKDNENQKKVIERIDVNNDLEYIFFIALQESNLYHAFKLFREMVTVLYGKQNFDLKHYYDKFFSFLVKNFMYYNLYQKDGFESKELIVDYLTEEILNEMDKNSEREEVLNHGKTFFVYDYPTQSNRFYLQHSNSQCVDLTYLEYILFNKIKTSYHIEKDKGDMKYLFRDKDVQYYLKNQYKDKTDKEHQEIFRNAIMELINKYALITFYVSEKGMDFHVKSKMVLFNSDHLKLNNETKLKSVLPKEIQLLEKIPASQLNDEFLYIDDLSNFLLRVIHHYDSQSFVTIRDLHNILFEVIAKKNKLNPKQLTKEQIFATHIETKEFLLLILKRLLTYNLIEIKAG